MTQFVHERHQTMKTDRRRCRVDDDMPAFGEVGQREKDREKQCRDEKISEIDVWLDFKISLIDHSRDASKHGNPGCALRGFYLWTASLRRRGTLSTSLRPLCEFPMAKTFSLLLIKPSR